MTDEQTLREVLESSNAGRGSWEPALDRLVAAAEVSKVPYLASERDRLLGDIASLHDQVRRRYEQIAELRQALNQFGEHYPINTSHPEDGCFPTCPVCTILAQSLRP